MKTIAKKDLYSKGELVIPKGSEFTVEIPERNRPHRALITYEGKKFGYKSVLLSCISEDFIRVLDEDLVSAMADSVCSSLRGYDVEPDGWDPDGFPSVLMAIGIV